MAWPIMLTAAQSRRLIEALEQYYEAAVTSSAVPRAFCMQLSVVLSMLGRGVAMDEAEAELLKWVLDSLFLSMEQDEWDEHLEKAYYKLYGEWPVDPPWFVKKLGLPPL